MPALISTPAVEHNPPKSPFVLRMGIFTEEEDLAAVRGEHLIKSDNESTLKQHIHSALADENCENYNIEFHARKIQHFYLYESSDLRQFSKAICGLSPAARLLILKSPTSSVRFSYSLILEHMLETVGASNANTSHNILEAAVEGLRSISQGDSVQHTCDKMLMENYTTFMAIGGILKYYEIEKGVRVGHRLACVRYIVSNEIDKEKVDDKDICGICLSQLFPDAEERLEMAHMANTEALGRTINHSVPLSWDPTSTDDDDKHLRSNKKCLVFWLPDFVHMIEPNFSDSSINLDKAKKWILYLNCLPVTSDRMSSQHYLIAGDVINCINNMRMMGLKLLNSIRQNTPEKIVIPEEIVTELSCGHHFHRECIKPWLMKNGICPHCRTWHVEWIGTPGGQARVIGQEGSYSRAEFVREVNDVQPESPSRHRRRAGHLRFYWRYYEEGGNDEPE